MNRQRKLLVGIATAVTLCVGMPLAKAAISGTSAPAVGLYAYANTQNGGCGESPTVDGSNLYVCAGENLGVTYDGAAHPGTGDFVWYSLDQCGTSGYCTYTYGFKSLPLGTVNSDPLLRTVSVNTDVDGCALNVTMTATGTPMPLQSEAIWPGPGPDVTLNGYSSAGVSRQVTQLSGTACGSQISGSGDQVYGTIFRSTEGDFSLDISTS